KRIEDRLPRVVYQSADPVAEARADLCVSRVVKDQVRIGINAVAVALPVRRADSAFHFNDRALFTGELLIVEHGPVAARTAVHGDGDLTGPGSVVERA